MHQVDPAEPRDLDGIHEALRANACDPSLAQQRRVTIERNLGEFLVLCDGSRKVLGCAQVKRHWPGYVEILAVSIRPEAQGQGLGRALMERAVEQALALGPGVLWLSTEKPGYFARFGFERFSKWRLPLPILIGKLGVVLQQRVERWVPMTFGRPVFMRYRFPDGDGA